MQHHTEQTRTYPCRACGGELVFHIGEQKLACPHCGNMQELAEADSGAVAERDFDQAIAELRASADSHTGPQLAGEKEVVCQNCGGHTTFTGTLVATRCPYCATPVQRDDIHDAPARLAVDGVLPFQVDQRRATGLIEEWINSRWFAPSEFKKYSRTGSFTSVYAAYFAYDADTVTRYTGRRGDNYTEWVGDGKDRRAVTRTRWRHVSGTVQDRFDDLCVLANEGFDRRHVDRLEPWPTQQAVPFSPEYVAGHLCRTYDHDVEQCFGTARQRMDATIRTTVRRDIGGDHQDINSLDTRFLSLAFKHLLLPIWLLTVIFEGRPFQVFINGVTGEVHGQRPWSKIKIAIAVTVAVVVLAVVLAVWQATGNGR